MGHQNEKAGQSNGAEYKRVGIAPSITFGLDTPTRATLSYYYLQTDDKPDSGIPYWDSSLEKLKVNRLKSNKVHITAERSRFSKARKSHRYN